jgi:Replication-relaxation
VVGRPRLPALVADSALRSVPGDGRRQASRSWRAPATGREQVLHLIGRHPFLAVDQLANLLGTTTARIRRVEQELVESGWLRRIELDELPADTIGLGSDERRALGLVEITIVGRRRLASWLGLGPTVATRYHGLIGNARGQAGRRRRLLQTLAHTLGANAVFVAFAMAADTARRQGGTDLLADWRGAAACERRHCKPDGYGSFVRNGVAYGFLLEYDRGTESARKYAAKFRAYYRYRDSGNAATDYEGFPTLLFVTTDATAEHRILDQAYRAWFVRGTEALPVLVTTTRRISQHREGILGPIWRSPAAAPAGNAEQVYWLPGGPAAGLRKVGGQLVPSPRLVWPTPRAVEVALRRPGLRVGG